MAKTTKADFEAFKKTAQGVVDKLGITDYDLSFVHDDDDDDGRLGWTGANLEAMVAKIGLVVDWDEHPTDRQIILDVAKHEALELLLIEFQILAQERGTTKKQLDKARHRAINRLMRLV